MPEQWEDSPVYGVAVAADEETMHVQQDAVKAAIEAKADEPIYDEPAPPTAPPEPEDATLPSLKPGWGAKTGWGGGGVPMPSFGSWADDDD